jgi:hypothetical protein
MPKRRRDRLTLADLVGRQMRWSSGDVEGEDDDDRDHE